MAYSVYSRVTDYSIYEPCRVILNSGTHNARIRRWFLPSRPSPSVGHVVIASATLPSPSLSLVPSKSHRKASRSFPSSRGEDVESEIDSICASSGGGFESRTISPKNSPCTRRDAPCISEGRTQRSRSVRGTLSRRNDLRATWTIPTNLYSDCFASHRSTGDNKNFAT